MKHDHKITAKNGARQCYVILETQCDDHGYIPSLVIEGEPGYAPMYGEGEQEPWRWGKTIERAREVCARYNQQHYGLTEQAAERIVASSMNAQNQEQKT